MKKLLKKSLAVFLSVIIALSVASVAFANYDFSTETQENEEIVATGSVAGSTFTSAFFALLDEVR